MSVTFTPVCLYMLPFFISSYQSFEFEGGMQ